MSLKNPYKGLFQYHSSDEHFFFGREQEAEELLDMVKNNHLVVIYGESGTGKTSLINAKLFPELRRQYYFPIYIRLNYTSDSTPVKQIQERIVTELRDWDESIPDFAEGQTLIDYTSSINIFSGLIKPILFFDQFEELFTLGPKNQKAHVLEEFISQLSDLIEVRISQSKKKILAERYAAAGNGADYRSNYEENLLRFRIVFSMRQEFVAHIDDLKYKMPSVLYSKYWLKKFTSRNALEAILGPAEIAEKEYREDNYPVEYLTQNTARKIVEKLLGTDTNADSEMLLTSAESTNRFTYPSTLLVDIIDPTILSLYCYRLVEMGIENHNQGTPVVTDDLAAKYEPAKIIGDYYELSLRNAKKVKAAIERFLITNEGLRLIRPLDEFVRLSKVKETDVVDLSSNYALLRIYGDKSGREVEIAHDQIAEYAFKSRKRREANRIKIRAAVIGVAITAFIIAIVGLFTWLNEKREEDKIVAEQKREEETKKFNNKAMSMKDSMKAMSGVTDLLVLERRRLEKIDSINHKSIADVKAMAVNALLEKESLKAKVDELTTELTTANNDNQRITELRSNIRNLQDSVKNKSVLIKNYENTIYRYNHNSGLQVLTEKNEQLMIIMKTYLNKQVADSIIQKYKWQ